MYNTTNFDSWLVNSLGRAEAATENTIYTTGTGTAAPLGIDAATGSTVANTLATADTILPSELAAFVGYLGAGYNVPSECAFVMANVTKWYLRGLTASAGAFVYQSTPDGMVSNDQLMGYKIVTNDDVSPYTTNAAKIIFLGNWNYYGIVEKPGMIVQRNPYLYMANGQIGIFASIFRGGSTLQREAIYYLTNQT
jgi:HK97 family phage major capsid protein